MILTGVLLDYRMFQKSRRICSKSYIVYKMMITVKTKMINMSFLHIILGFKTM